MDWQEDSVVRVIAANPGSYMVDRTDSCEVSSNLHTHLCMFMHECAHTQIINEGGSFQKTEKWTIVISGCNAPTELKQ